MTNDQNNNAPAPLRFLRLPEVMNITGLSRSTVYRLAGRGEFPEQFKLSTRTAAWDAAEVQQWMADKVAERSARTSR
jgi:prophage regulatory protein